jgi:NADH:flavin oxidoreductase / NADH oxidase family
VVGRNAPAVVEDPSHEKRELRPQVRGLFRRQAIAQDVQHRSQRPVGGPTITAGGYTTETAVSAIEAKLGNAVAFGRMFIANPDLPQAHPSWGAAERLRPFDGLWRRRTRLFMFSSSGFTGESRRAIFLRRSQGIVGSATTTISGPVVRAAKFSPTLASC